MGIAPTPAAPLYTLQPPCIPFSFDPVADKTQIHEQAMGIALAQLPEDTLPPFTLFYCNLNLAIRVDRSIRASISLSTSSVCQTPSRDKDRV
jgi:hypothetical protein